MVKIMGQSVRIGTKKYNVLKQQKKHFEDLLKWETN